MLAGHDQERRAKGPSERAPTGAPQLFTWHHRAALVAQPGDVTLVRISVGRPRLGPRAIVDAMPYVAELAPVGLLGIEDRAAFDAAYVEQLVVFGVAEIDQRLREVAAAHGQLLLLLCVEPDRHDCHGGTFATWWTRRAGEEVPEYV